MKNFNPKNALNLSHKQLTVLFASSIIVLVIAFIAEVSHQHGEAKTTFNHSIDQLIQEQKQAEKRTTILLNSLSQYYETNLIKSSHEFESFAKGLYDHTSKIYAIGFANYLPKEQKIAFEQHKQQQGYESYQIKAKGLFEQERPNHSHHHLAVSMITPLDPVHSTYLSEDLFSLSDFAEKFIHSTQTNQAGSQLLQFSQNKQFYTLAFKPIYLNKPTLLSQSERQNQVRGAVFIILPTEAVLFSQIQALSPTQKLSLTSKLAVDKTPMLSQLIQTDPKQLLNFFPFKDQFDRQTTLISTQPETQINLSRYWYLEELQVIPLISSMLIALVLYISVVGFAILIFRYTQNLQHTQNRLMQIITTSQDAVIVTNKDGYIKVWNPVASQLFGYSEEESLGQCLMLLIFYHSHRTLPKNAEEEKNLIQNFWHTFGLEHYKNSQQKVELELHTQLGQKIIAEIAVSILKNDKKQDNIEVSLFIKDMTYQRQTEAEIKQLAYFDPLTNLENRTFFKSQVEKYIEQNKYSKFAFLFLDLDGFKQVNDSLGHSVGDELLKVISKRIVHTLRGVDRDTHICRFGGDEFVLMLGHVDEEQAPKVALRILKQIERVVKVKDDELQVTGSIGIAFFPQHGNDVDTLLRHADTAMYQSKDSGKNIYSIYNDDMEERLSRRLLLEKHLRNALALEEFSLVYQPKIDLSTGQVTGVEALVRWNNPVLGFVSPDDFISIAEESNLIINIGSWVANRCIEQLITWKNTPFEDLHIAINVSSQQLQHPFFLEQVSTMMEEASLPTHLLEIELTERTIMSNAKENILRFNEIRERGFELSVDDFGTGYSSLSYLKKFPLSILKIDKSFVDGLPYDEEDVSIAKAILSLAHNLNMRVVAEGVETQEQLEFLRNLHCNYAQGYYISRPITIDALETWLSANSNNFYHEENTLLLSL